MYTRTDSPLHIIQEVIDNASDEMLAGFGTRIDVTLHGDGSVSVDDDGRGIPVGLHPEEKVPVVEIVFTRLHAGGKFDKRAGGAYSFAGGLHGVGVSVTNALSSRLDVTVWRDGKLHTIGFADGEVSEPIKSETAKGERQASGTRVRAWPDREVLRRARKFRVDELERLLRSKAVLLPGTDGLAHARKVGSDAALALRGRAARRTCLERLPPIRCSRPSRRADSPRRTTTTTSPRARAPAGSWSGPKTAPSRASPT